MRMLKLLKKLSSSVNYFLNFYLIDNHGFDRYQMKFAWVDLLCVVCKDVGDCPLRNILKKKKKKAYSIHIQKVITYRERISKIQVGSRRFPCQENRRKRGSTRVSISTCFLQHANTRTFIIYT